MIIGLTAHALEEDRRACLEAGMDRYVAKPVTLEKLSAVLDELTSKARTNESDRLAALRRALGDEALDRLIDECLADAQSLLDRIDGALAADDDDDLLKAAHMLASTSAIMGADDLSAASASIQTAIRGRDLDAAHLTARTLRAMFDSARAALRP